MSDKFVMKICDFEDDSEDNSKDEYEYESDFEDYDSHLLEREKEKKYQKEEMLQKYVRLLIQEKFNHITCINIQEYNYKYRSVVISDKAIIFGCWDGSIKISSDFNVKNTPSFNTLKGHIKPVTCVFAYNNRIISGSDDCTIRVWDLNSDKCYHILQGHTSPITCLFVTEEYIVSGSYDKTIRIWNTDTGENIKVLRGHSEFILKLTVTSNYIISGDYSSDLLIWNIDTGENVKMKHYSCLSSICISDNKMFTSNISYSHCIEMCELDLEKKETYLFSLVGHTEWISCMTIIGKHLISGSQDRTIRIWDLDERSDTYCKCIKTLVGHTGRIISIHATNDTIISYSADKTVRFWKVSDDYVFDDIPSCVVVRENIF